ncbi:MAG: hypothetical protein ACI9YE_001129 [Psychroserpens sp.]|jgi:hypothetical protein
MKKVVLKMVFKTSPFVRDLSTVSSVFASQAKVLIEDARKESHTKYVRVLRRVKQLIPILPATVQRLDLNDAELFREKGLDAFINQDYWIEFEHALYHSVLNSDKAIRKDVKNVQTATENLICQHFNKELKAPHSLLISGNKFNLFALNALPIKHVVEAKKIVSSVAESLMNDKIHPGKHIRNIKRDISGFVYLLMDNMRNPVISKALNSNVTLNDILTQQKYIESLLSFEGITKNTRLHAKLSLKRYNPDTYIGL